MNKSLLLMVLLLVYTACAVSVRPHRLDPLTAASQVVKPSKKSKQKEKQKLEQEALHVLKDSKMLTHQDMLSFKLDDGGELECFCRFLDPASVAQRELTSPPGLAGLGPHHCFESCQKHKCKYIYREEKWKEWFSCLQDCRKHCYDQESDADEFNEEEACVDYEDALSPESGKCASSKGKAVNIPTDMRPEVIVLEPPPTSAPPTPAPTQAPTVAPTPAPTPKPTEPEPKIVYVKPPKTNPPRPVIPVKLLKELINDISQKKEKKQKEKPSPPPPEPSKKHNVTINLEVVPLTADQQDKATQPSDQHHVIDVIPKNE